jgi:hypothetical protein
MAARIGKGHITPDNFCCNLQHSLGYTAMLLKKRSQGNCEHGLDSTHIDTFLHNPLKTHIRKMTEMG